MSETPLFKLVANYQPAGDQVNAIEKVSSWIEDGVKDMTIHGITGSGKTFTMANIIQKVNRPAIIYSPNKILAYQLYEELKTFFPHNEVHYFVSTFDMYRPEFVKYGEFHSKKSVTNEVLEQMVLDAQSALSSGKRDVIIVASSSCLFGTGSPEMYRKSTVEISIKNPNLKTDLIIDLLHSGYREVPNVADLSRGTYVNRPSSMFICSNQYENNIKVWELKFDPEQYLERINFRVRDKDSNDVIESHDNMMHGHIFPATRYAQDVYTEEELDVISKNILDEASKQANRLHPDRYQLLVQRIEDDLNSIRSDGYCNGIENYAWYFNRKNMYRKYDPADYVNMQPYTMMSYLPEDTIMFVDESHLALGQIEGAAAADLSRKIDLIEAGIRLPSCVINRPLKKHEVREKNFPTVYVSATPREEEKELSGEHICPLFIRPTYLLDPDIEVVYVEELEKSGQSYNEHVISQIAKTKARGGAVLLRCPSSKICVHYHSKLTELGFKAEVMLADTPAPKRRELVERLQAANQQLEPLDVIIGVNLIREGLDIPRVETVLIVDAHNGGFLNDTTSLIQVIGRAARNANGKVFIYINDPSKMTPQIQNAIDQTLERRALQQAYNQRHHKTPTTAVANSYLNNLVAQSYNPEEDELFLDTDAAVEMDAINHITDAQAQKETAAQTKKRLARDMMRQLLADMSSEELDQITTELAANPSKENLRAVKTAHTKAHKSTKTSAKSGLKASLKAKLKGTSTLGTSDLDPAPVEANHVASNNAASSVASTPSATPDLESLDTAPTKPKSRLEQFKSRRKKS